MLFADGETPVVEPSHEMLEGRSFLIVKPSRLRLLLLHSSLRAKGKSVQRDLRFQPSATFCVLANIDHAVLSGEPNNKTHTIYYLYFN